jgi:5-methyltetrahydropteroyltriglutamate--homocysteine methyltransferase
MPLSTYDHPLPTMGVGSYATPGWLFPFREAMRAGRTGPEDEEEAFEDATRIVIDDQIDAGVDVISDGELRRQRFVYEMYDRIGGLSRIPPSRKLGLPGYDRAPKFTANERVTAVGGLGLVDEYRALARLAPGRRLKIAFPGPLTFVNNISPGDAYSGSGQAHEALLEDIVAMLRAEVEALAGSGAEMIQIDEPGLTHLPEFLTIETAAAPINAVIAGHEEIAAVHVCYGNNASRPYAKRDMGRLLPAIEQLRSEILFLEFANREMSEIELLGNLSEKFSVAVGVIDVKSFHIESAEDVAERLSRALAHAPAEKLLVTADCGFSAIPRWLARAKMRAMVAGAELARSRL